MYIHICIYIYIYIYIHSTRARSVYSPSYLRPSAQVKDLAGARHIYIYIYTCIYITIHIIHIINIIIIMLIILIIATTITITITIIIFIIIIIITITIIIIIIIMVILVRWQLQGSLACTKLTQDTAASTAARTTAGTHRPLNASVRWGWIPQPHTSRCLADPCRQLCDGQLECHCGACGVRSGKNLGQRGNGARGETRRVPERVTPSTFLCPGDCYTSYY